MQRPWLGHGEGQVSFSVPTADRLDVLHPHNLPLQVLHAWGLIGSTMFIAIGIMLARRLAAIAREKGSAVVPPLLGIVALLVFSAYDGTLYHVQASATFFACLGTALALGRREAA